MLSKSTLKYLVYCQVFWVEVRRLQDQCISIWVLVLYYCNSNNLLAEKLWYKCNSINEVFPNMFSNKIYIFLYKKVKVKKIFIVVVWVFLIFVFFFLFLSMFFFCLLLCQAIFRWLASSWKFFFVFKDSNLQFLKKIQVQMIVFNMKAVVKIYRIFGSNSPLFLYKCLKNCVLNFLVLNVN